MPQSVIVAYHPLRNIYTTDESEVTHNSLSTIFRIHTSTVSIINSNLSNLELLRSL